MPEVHQPPQAAERMPEVHQLPQEFELARARARSSAPTCRPVTGSENFEENDEGDSSASSSAPVACGKPEPGDIVILGSRSPNEFRQCPAVVTKVAEVHCTVSVLDEARRFAIGECWPGFGDIEFESCLWRLGSRVVIGGLKRGLLNGFSGRVAAHPKEGHPTFLIKSDPSRPQLTICVRLDDPVAAGKKTVLLEPRFLTPYAEHVRKVAKDLVDLRASLTSMSDTANLSDNADHLVDQLHSCGGA